MSVPPQRSEVLQRERRWMRPAGAAAIYGAIAIQVGLYVGGSALDADGTAERLLEASKGDADGQLLLGALISASGFLALAIPLTVLFLAARARSDRLLRQLVALPAIGAVMIAGGLVLNNHAFLDAADKFAASEATREAAPSDAKQGETATGDGGKTGKSPQSEEGNKKGETTTPEAESTTTESTAAETTTEADQSSEDVEKDAEEEADDRGDDALKDASGSSAAALLVRGGALAFAIALFYTSLWSMRVGLLTRFWGSLGMASAVVLALFFLYFFALVWFLAMGLMLLGAWVGRRPPAWEAGIAIPWPRPGDRPDESGGDIEGHGRELSEPPLPEAEDQNGEGGPPRPDEPPPEPPQKRKRRR